MDWVSEIFPTRNQSKKCVELNASSTRSFFNFFTKSNCFGQLLFNHRILPKIMGLFSKFCYFVFCLRRNRTFWLTNRAVSNEQNNDKFFCSFSAPASPLVKSLSMGPLQCVKSSSSSSLFTLCLDIVITAEIPVYFAVLYSREQRGWK